MVVRRGPGNPTGFRSGQRVDGKLALHERKQVWLGRGLPFEQQPGGRTRHRIKDVLLDAFDGNPDIGLDSNTADVHV